MDKQQKKRVKKYISWVVVVTLVVLLAVMPMLAKKEETTDGPQASVLSAAAEKRNIAAYLVGGGTLASEAAVEITIPSAVKITEYLVRNGDIVEAGDTIAAVDRVTVMTAITQVQETLDHLAEEIEAASGEDAAGEVTAQAGGTVKIIYAEEGESVQDVMLEHGALAVLSLDGLMAVRVERNTDLSGGDPVCVTLSDGTEVEGEVASNLEGVLTVTIADGGYEPGETVKVTTEDGDRVGSGTLYIHSQWNATAYSGFVSGIQVSEGDTVRAGKTLFVLEDTGHTAEFDALTRQHREYEARMLELFQMYQSESVTAPCGGMVTGVDENGAYMLSAGGSGWSVSLLANAPNGNDETAYVNYIGQVAEVGIDGLILKMNPQQLAITDYKDLSMVPMDTALMTEDVIYTAEAPVYELSGGEWTQIQASAIAAGDVLLFAGDADGSFVWVVRVAKGTGAPETSDPAGPTVPSEPDTPEVPSEPTQPDTPEEPSESTEPSRSDSGFPQGGAMPGIGGGTSQEETFEMYALDTVTIASVTAQEEMTVTITVDELDISRIYAGQTADVTVDALSGGKFTAAVTKISNSGENEGGNSKFTVELTLEKAPDMLAGMQASVVINGETVEDAVAVPVAALIEDGTRTYLYTSYDERTKEFGDPVTVTVGASDGEYVQILSGIGEGTTCYYPYYDTLVISNAPDVSRGFPFG